MGYFMRVKKGDIIILVVLIAAVASWLLISNMGDPEASMQVVIETDGEVYTTIPYRAGMEKQEIHIELNNGNHIDIVIDEKGAYVEDVICPDKICQKTGIINQTGQSIVCLPNRVVVYMEGDTEPEVDNISF
jgi:hypothetical protein